MSELKTKEIKALEIFQSGTHNGDFYSEADLDAMVDAFDKVGFEPTVKAGHQEGQENSLVAGAVFGEPALGYVERIWRQGSKLLADIKSVPQRFANLILAGSYKRVSSEIYWDFESEDEVFPRVLKAIAFLGADIPALTSLRAVEALFKRTATCVAYDDSGNEYHIYEIERAYQPSNVYNQTKRSFQMQHFNELFARYSRGDQDAGAIINEQVKTRQGQTGESYTVALKNLRTEARTYEHHERQEPDALQQTYTAWQRGDSQASRVMDSIFKARAERSGKTYAETMRTYSRVANFESLAVVRVTNLVIGFRDDDLSIDIERALAAVNNDAAALADAQQACQEMLDYYLDRQMSINGVPGVEREVRAESIALEVESEYPGLAGCADGGEFSEDALLELCWPLFSRDR